MTTFYFINWATPTDWDCYVDDRGNCECLEHLANPVGLPYLTIDEGITAATDEHDAMTGQLDDGKDYSIVNWTREEVENETTARAFNAAGELQMVLIARKFTI